MKFSEQWLREWVNPPVSVQELGEQLTMAGLELDSIEPAAAEFSKVVVAHVLKVEPHPDADKLRVCQVEVGENEPLQIVCGAANVRDGLKVPAALVGARLPGDLKIKKAKLRGVASTGMLCSETELGIAESSDGLMELPDDAPTGTDIREYLLLDDSLLEVDLTPNRGDCLGMAGIAREVGVLNRVPVVEPEISSVDAAIDDVAAIEIHKPEACPRYLGRVIRGVDAGAQTPMWMQEKLRRSGIRSLGPLVDVTNYVMVELGQPMHAFDLARIDGGIVVRDAEKGEQLTLLDGKTIELEYDTLLICDASKPLALAGIMGGEDSGVGDSTTDIFLECAFFAPLAIAGKARSYGMQTDSSYRFERGVDPELQKRAMERATELLLSICGGRCGPVSEVCHRENLPVRPEILLREKRLERLIGISIAADDVTDMLQRLGMDVEREENGWLVRPPAFRFDIAIEADLIEEVGRIYGYDKLPSRVPRVQLRPEPMSESQLVISRLKQCLVDREYQEVITYSFIDPADQARIDPDKEPQALANPISSEMAVMRTSLLPGLLNTLDYNQKRQQARVRLFESGLNFIKQDTELKQINMLAAVISGEACAEQWAITTRPADFYDLKADLEALLALTGRADAFSFSPASHPALHPGQSAELLDQGQHIGWIGALHPEILKKQGLSAPVIVFEVALDNLQQARIPSFEPLSKFPSIRRDLAIVVDEGVTASQISDVISRSGGENLQDLLVFDVYRGKGVDSGRKSVALGLILQDYSRTLTDKDVEEIIEPVLQGLQKELNATLRE
jgi:phenylalanyl-tRNA synthetase beta chain